MELDFEQAEFSLAEAERITGISTDAIRTWKRRGLLDTGGAYQKLTVSILASLLLRKQLVDGGYQPAEARAIGDRFANDILYFATLDTRGSCEVVGSPDAVGQFEVLFNEDSQLAAHLSSLSPPAVTTLVSVNGSPLEPETIEALVIDQDAFRGHYINLHGLGRYLGAACRKPLFYIRLEEAPAGARSVIRRVPRMTS